MEYWKDGMVDGEKLEGWNGGIVECWESIERME